MAKGKKKSLRATVVETPNPQGPEQLTQQNSSKGKRCWSKRFYIPGFGFVDVGEQASSEALAAWKAATKVDVEGYLKKE